MEEERFIDGNPLDEGEVQAELSLRPQTLQQYIGQQKVKEEACRLYSSGPQSF